MITIAYSTHKDEEYNKKFKQRLIESTGLKNIQILEYINHNEFSLASIYNRAIKESIHNIVVCIHNDVKLETGWGKKLLKDFENNPEYAIIGKAGSCYFPESGIYWEKMFQTMVGQVYHFPEGQKKWLNKYSPKFSFLIPVVTIDGLFISFDKTKIIHGFDESIGKFHFYDHPFCISNYLDGVKIGVTSSFEITHQSIGRPNEEFYATKDEFLKKYKQHLPLDLKPMLHYSEDFKKKIKEDDKIAIIIPTKGNWIMLHDCIRSFSKYCDINNFEIFIADTGSDDKIKENIKNFCELSSDFHFIEYDYYNFGKINNDVVKNHISNDFKYLLFCNNDVEILNDIIGIMLSVFNEKKNAGTVGARLHYPDNRVQHNGMSIVVSEERKSLSVFDMSLGSYYNYHEGLTPVFGNSAALLMIRKSVFDKIGGFNEKYTHCFEDAELNIKTIKLGFENYLCGNAVAYHKESATRDVINTTEQMTKDYNEILLPTIMENWNILNSKAVFV